MGAASSASRDPIPSRVPSIRRSNVCAVTGENGQVQLSWAVIESAAPGMEYASNSGSDQPDDCVIPIRGEGDMNHARMLARETCKLVSLRGYQAQKVVTAVSELARNIARYAGSGRMSFRVDTTSEFIIVTAEDEGPGINNLDEILAGNYRSRTGLGRGLLGSRDLADHFDIHTSPNGTIVKIAFYYGASGGGGAGSSSGSKGKPWTT
jgi:serine/threonine-protein kinase RsbT